MPLLDLLWTTLLIFGWVLWFMLLFRVYGDLFSRQDIGGWAKAAWTVFTLFMPFLGVFVYLISQGRGMAERTVEAIQRQQAAHDAHIRAVAAEMVASGEITPEPHDRMVPAPR